MKVLSFGKNWPTWFPIMLILANIILKIIYLDSRDIAMDEPFTIFYSQADLADIFKMLPGENNPPLFFLLLHFWIKLFGISAFSVRFLPFIFSVITALVIFRTGQRFFSIRVGMVGSLLYTFSNYQMLFAHEARVYSLFALLTSCSMYLFLMSGSRRGSRTTVVLLTMINILLVYSHFFGFFVIATEIFAVLVIRQYRFSILKQVFISSAIVLFFYIPYLPVFVTRYTATAHAGTWVSPPVFSDLYTMLWRYSNVPLATVFFIGIIAAGGIFWIKRYHNSTGTGSPEGKLVILWFLAPYTFMFLLSFICPMFLDRYTVFISIGYYLTIAMSLDAIASNRWLFGFISIAALLLMVFTFHPNIDNRRRLKEVAVKVGAYKTPGTVVIICPSWLEYGFAYHYRLEYFKDYRNLRRRLGGEGIYPVDALSQLDTVAIKEATSVLYFEEWATLVDKKNKIQNWLSTGFNHVSDEKVVESFILHRYTRPIRN